MNVKYFHEFKGEDEVLNRFEILTNEAVTPVEIEGQESPFVLEYPDQGKLVPVQGSGADIRIISNENFQFAPLFTTDMQAYMVKFYRDGTLFWMGWLQAEMYEERLCDSPPYPVSLSAADFNILERIKYLDEDKAQYTDVPSLLTHILRCLQKVHLPFEFLYVGSSTSVGVGVNLYPDVLEKTYLQSTSFYDEDGEPMSCREVLETILQPLGLTLIQRDGSLFIFDYNKLLSAPDSTFYRYNYPTTTPRAQVTYSLSDFGNVANIGLATVDGTYGFEEPINHLVIKSDAYVINPDIERVVEEGNMYDSSGAYVGPDYTEDDYSQCTGWKMFGTAQSARNFRLYKDTVNVNRLVGYSHARDGSPLEPLVIDCELTTRGIVIPRAGFSLNLKMDAYLSDSGVNPFIPNTTDRETILYIYAYILLLDENDVPVYYYANSYEKQGWYTYSGAFDYYRANSTILMFWKNFSENYNQWHANSNARTGNPRIYNQPYGTPVQEPATPDDRLEKGLAIPTPPRSGKIKIIFSRAHYNILDTGVYLYPLVLLNNIRLTEVNPNEDFEDENLLFDSYIDEQALSDKELELKCSSLPSEFISQGLAVLLYRTSASGTLVATQTWKRGAQGVARIEELLLCTIHSNYSRRNEKWSAALNMTGNPMMSYIQYTPLLSEKYLITGCEMDFAAAATTIHAVGFSQDTEKLSDLPYGSTSAADVRAVGGRVIHRTVKTIAVPRTGRVADILYRK